MTFPPPPPQVRIVNTVLHLAETYAKLAAAFEISGFLLSSVAGGIIDGLILADDQVATAASIEISPEAVLHAGAVAAQRNKLVQGWFHSHAALSAFHSSTDDAQLSDLADQLALSNAYTRPHPLPNGTSIPALASVTYSLVVNARSHASMNDGDAPYVKVCEKTWCPCCGREDTTQTTADLIVVPEPLDEGAMLKELRSKVRVVGAARGNPGLLGWLIGSTRIEG